MRVTSPAQEVARRYQQGLAVVREALDAASKRMGPHRGSLLISAAAILVGQFVVLRGQFFGGSLLDTGNYLSATINMLQQGQFFDPLRTPGYPVFLALFLVSGIAHPLFWVVVAQTLLTVLTTLLIYLLSYRVTHQQPLATLVTVVVATNPFLLQWERTILSETLSYWVIVMLFLIFEWYLRTRRPSGIAALVFFSILAVMIRPFNIYVPIVLFLILALTDLRIGLWRRTWRVVLAGVVVTYGVFTMYMAGNAVVNHFFNISEVTNINLFGKVLEYRLYDQTSDPQYQQIKANIDAYAATVKQPDPFYFIFGLHPEYQQDGIAELGAYSRSILLSHAGTVIRHTGSDLLLALRTPALIYSFHVNFTANGDNTLTAPSQSWRTAIEKVTNIEFLVYDLLPLLLVLAVVAWWRTPRRPANTVLLALTLTVAGNIFITGALSYDQGEFSRLRFPGDWAMFLLIIVFGQRLGAWLWPRLPFAAVASPTKTDLPESPTA
jgi:hypothetical protein